MALIDITVDFDLHQILGSDFDARRTKAYVTTNVDNATLIDTSTGETRLGDQPVTINADGTGSFTTWRPEAGVSNPASWQTSLVVDHPRTGHRDRARRIFGPYTITGDRTVTWKQLTSNVATLWTDKPHGLTVGSVITVTGVGAPFDGTHTVTAVYGLQIEYAKTAANVTAGAATGTMFSPNVSLALLEDEQAIPPNYQTAFTASMEAIRDEAEAARDETNANINGLGIGTTTTGPAGSSSNVTLTGTAPTRLFNFTIPRGDQGLPGPGAAAWAASQAVVVGSVRQAPDGSWIKSTATRTTGSTFDATEQGFWATVSATAGTMEQTALSGTFVPLSRAATTAQQGIVELATNTETTTGTDTVRAITPAAGFAAYVQEGSAFADLGKQTGVDNTGTTECAAAINTALNGFLALGVRAYAKGTFKIASTVTIAGNADLSDATFNYTAATGTALVIGSSTSGDEIFDITVHTPKVVAVAKTVAGWAEVAGTIGVDISNLYHSTVHLSPIRHFETNLRTYGKGTGCVHNEIHVTHLDNGKVNQLISADGTGWSNQNTYVGGRWSHESAEGTNVAGTRQIEMAVTTNGVNNNKWDNPSLEGTVPEFTAIFAGSANVIDNGRWEVTGGAKVKWASNAIGNEIRGGYQANNIIQTWVAGSGKNRLRTTDFDSFIGSGVAALANGQLGGIILENQTSSANPILAVMEAGAGPAATVTGTGYAVALSAQTFRGKRATDTFDRLKFDFVNGRFYFGSGAADPTQYLSRSGTAVAFNGTHVDFLPDNTYDLGETGARPRDLKVGRNATIGGALDHDGTTVGFYGATPVTKAASPGTATGTDAAVINALITALRNLGLVT